MALLTTEQLLTRSELLQEKVVLDVEKDEFVYVRQMTAHEKSIWEMSQLQKTGTGQKAEFNVTLDDYRAKLAVVCICDESGKLLLKPSQYLMLSQNISAAKLEKIVDVAQRLNAITEEDRAEITKN